MCPNFTMTLLFFLRMVWTIGMMKGKLTSYDPGPGFSSFFLFFLERRLTEPKGAYD